MRRRQTTVRLLLAIVVALSAIGSAVPPLVSAAPAAPHVNWSPCYRETGLPYECAVVPVPLDYSHPGAATILLALARLPAGSPSQRIGSLFLNPGGPGAPGIDFLLQVGPYLYSPEVRARFDLVGFDPRGVARSTGLKCFGNDKQALAAMTSIAAFPLTREQAAAWEAADRQVVASCEKRAGRIIDHMTTADVARDLDLLRQAVGDTQLNYAGYSYGSYLGVTYANMFPEKVRALVVDAVLDPIAWATGRTGEATTTPIFNRLRSVEGAEATLSEFFRLCDSGVQCAFAPGSAVRFDALAERVKSTPIVLTLPDGSDVAITYQYLMEFSREVMYTPSVWPDFAQVLWYLETLASPTVTGDQLWAVAKGVGLVTERGTLRYLSPESLAGVMCSDSDNPSSYQVWWDTAAEASARFTHFGAIYTWVSSICATWEPGPSDSRYSGPFTAWTSSPVLVVGNYFDPATPYHGAVTVHTLLPNSALLTVDGWGHASLLQSSCADATVSNYLLTGATPPEGTICPVDVVPFAPASAQAQAGMAGQPSAQSLRAEWLGEILPFTPFPSVP